MSEVGNEALTPVHPARHLTAGGPAPIAFDEIAHSTRATLAAWESLMRGEAVVMGQP